MSFSAKPELLSSYQMEFARLALGILVETSTSLPLTAGKVTDAGGVISVTLLGDQGLAAVLDLNASTHEPLAVRYMTDFPAGAVSGMAQSGTNEVKLRFSARRDVTGFHLPFRITRTVKDTVIEDMGFDTVTVNAPGCEEAFTR